MQKHFLTSELKFFVLYKESGIVKHIYIITYFRNVNHNKNISIFITNPKLFMGLHIYKTIIKLKCLRSLSM